MKKFFTKALILTFGFGVAASFTACHNESGSGSSTEPEQTTYVAPKHSIRGVILKEDGSALTGASVTIKSGATNITPVISGNTFSSEGLSAGTYEVEVTRAGFKSGYETVTLATVTDEKGNESGMNVERVFYLAENAEQAIVVTTTGTSTDEVTLFGSDSKDEDGDKTNTTDETIVAEGTVDGLTTSNVNEVTVTDENGNTTAGDVDDLTNIIVTNITSLEDAKAVARASKVASARTTRANTMLPNGEELLAGVAVNVGGNFKINLPGTLTFDVNITIPEEVKSALSKDASGNIRVYCTQSGDAWEALTVGKYGVKEIVTNQTGKIIIKMNPVQTVSFAIGVNINENAETPSYEEVTAIPITNNSASSRTVRTMAYTIKGGVVLTTTATTGGALNDFLRKIVLRRIGTSAVKTAKSVQKTYRFDPAYTMHPYGVLYLQGFQSVVTTQWSIVGAEISRAGFNSVAYGDAFVYPYEVWTEIPETHSGGTN